MERFDNQVLIVTDTVDLTVPRQWFFPRGPVRTDESPEAAMRRIALETLGIHVEVVVGQPPLIQAIDGVEVELRYVFCGINSGEPIRGAYPEIRWLPKGQLREYDFDPASQTVVDWLIEG
jgi:hypothetical protein